MACYCGRRENALLGFMSQHDNLHFTLCFACVSSAIDMESDQKYIEQKLALAQYYIYLVLKMKLSI